MDDISEQQQVSEEISNAISNPVGFSDDVDEDELLRELEDLQDQDLEAELLNIPAAPTNKLPQTSNISNLFKFQIKKFYVNFLKLLEYKTKESDMEDELRKMAAWADS